MAAPTTRELCKLGAVLAIGLLMHSFALYFIDYTTAGHTDRIIDIGFLLIPHRVYPISEDFLAVVYPAVVMTCLGYAGENKLIIRFVRQNIAVLCLRAVSVVSTILPSPTVCKRDPVFLIEVFHGGCQDKVFSGHLSYCLLAALFMHFHTPFGKNYGVLSHVVYIPVVVEAYIMISSRVHYTIDLVVAVIVVVLIFGFKPKRFRGPGSLPAAPFQLNLSGPVSSSG